jgi:protein SCO1/2
MNRKFALLFAGVLVFAASQAAAQHARHEGHAVRPPAASAELSLLSPQPNIGDIALVDHRGRMVTLREAVGDDKPVLLNFIFTSCTTICPVMTRGFAQFQASLGSELRNVRLVSISIDPDIDTVDTLREYAERYDAGDSWRFLTGTPEAVEAAQRAFGAFRGGKYNHAPRTYFRSSADLPWRAIEGLSSAETLLRAYRGQPAAESF